MSEERILVVEDNKTLAKLIEKKLSNLVDMQIDVAFNFAEAKLFMSRYKYFVTLLDVNLPDAPDGQVIDYAIEHKNHVLVLSGNIDKNFRKEILKKPVIDYVNKSGASDIQYIAQMIQRLYRNQNHKIMVVDDDRTTRATMKNILENMFYQVTVVAHGEEALNLIEQKNDYSMVIADYYMPVMNGLELTKELRKDYDKDTLCIIALSGNADEEINALFLKSGANDYIKKPFSKEEFSCRINNSIEALENIQTITKYANRDFLTGLYNRRYFYHIMNSYLEELEEQESNEQYIVAMLDIDFFKKINDTYGHDVGDEAIIALADILRSNVNNADIVARFGGEEFCIVLKNVDRNSAYNILERIRIKVEQNTIHYNKHKISYTVSIGATLFNTEESIDENLNAADLLLYKAKNSGRNQLVFE
jgi:diguanylate cyclase (GGDEF)-like protein